MESWLAHHGDPHLTDPSYSLPRLGVQGGPESHWDRGDPGERTSGSSLKGFTSMIRTASSSLKTQPPAFQFPDKAPIFLRHNPRLSTPNLQTSPPPPPPADVPSFEHILPTWGRTHTHRFSLGARRALHAWQPLIPFLTSLPRGADEAYYSDVALEDNGGVWGGGKGVLGDFPLEPRGNAFGEQRRPQWKWR